MRAATFTSWPMRSPARERAAPAWMPMRRRTPRAACCISSAARSAAAGDANAAISPSPRRFRMRPECRRMAGRTARSCRWTRRAAARSPRVAAYAVKPAMSVNITVSGRRRAARTGKRPASHSMPATGSIEASIVHLLPRYQHPSGVRREMAVRDGRPGFHAPPGRRVTDASMSPRPVSLAQLTERHRGEIVGYLARLLGDHQEAEDACQETFMRAHRAFGRLAPDANSRAWLYRIATNTGLNAARRRSHRAARRADVEPDALPAAAGPSLERREELRAGRRAVEARP